MIGAAVAGGSLIAGSLMQAYEGEKARGAAKERLQEIEAMFNQLVPPELNVKIYDDPEMLKGVPEPYFNTQAITPELYRTVGQYSPQAAAYVAEAHPELVQATPEAEEGRQAQLDALRKYQDTSRQGYDTESQIMMDQAARKGQAAAGSRVASTLEGEHRRGTLGGTAALAGQLYAGQAAGELTAQSSEDAALQAIRDRQMAMREGANLGGNIRASEMQEAGTNANIINDWNRRMSTNYQNYLNQSANMGNEAQKFNLGAAQDTANANVGEANKAKYEQVGRANTAAGNTYNIARQKLMDKIALAEGQNAVKQQDFNNQTAITQGKAGISGQIMQQDLQSSKDRNQMIQGLAQAGTQIGAAYDEDDEREKDRQAYGHTYK